MPALSLCWAFSTTPFTDEQTKSPRRKGLTQKHRLARGPRIGAAGELRRRCEKGLRRERTFSSVSLATPTAHSHSHPGQVLITIHVNGHSQWLSVPRAREGSR